MCKESLNGECDHGRMMALTWLSGLGGVLLYCVFRTEGRCDLSTWESPVGIQCSVPAEVLQALELRFLVRCRLQAHKTDSSLGDCQTKSLH